MLSIAGLAGCATPLEPRLSADNLALQAGLQSQRITAPPFVLQAYVRMQGGHQPIRVYIEGDGFAWANRYQPSRDPTPHRPIGLELAAIDSSPNLAYLARPCQYGEKSQTACHSAYWTGRRFAPEVIAAMSMAISALKIDAAQKLELVGYSGGGAIAAILAAQRQDVISLRTVAGNLDHEYVNRLHGVSSMPDSLNARDYTAKLLTMPQLHVTGALDDIVPSVVAADFIRRQQPAQCARMMVMPQATHQQGWQAAWPQLLEMPLPCHAGSHPSSG